MRNPLLPILILCALLSSPLPAHAWPAVVIDVHDGDTITVRRSNGQAERLRLYGIDAPELAQPGGTDAADHLRELLHDGTAEVRTMDRDRYGRTVARIWTIDGQDVNEAMVTDGHAWFYAQYCKAPSPCAGWLVQMVRAAIGGSGLWSGSDLTPPWDWRKARRQRAEASTTEE